MVLTYSIDSLESEIQRLTHELNHAFDGVKAANLRKFKVIGMTTTGAAKNCGIIEQIGVKFLVCEEASEILESHLLALLHQDLQHVICIGDHLQLRPHVLEYELSMESREGARYALDMSLFERLQQTESRFPCFALETQRRMRPEISRLVRSTVYPYLQDSPTVLDRPRVLGMEHNTFLFTHDHPEGNRFTGEKSYSNVFEAKMVVHLTKYLLQQGYLPSQITILTPYLGQLLQLRNMLGEIAMVAVDERDLLQIEETALEQDLDESAVNTQRETVAVKINLRDSIRVSTVDNFQGEENRIIIVSLVRNAGLALAGTIGFLKIRNRNNVLLSRAKEGMFLLGQASLLEKESPMWKQVIDIMDADHLVGTSFSIRCQKHPEYQNAISDPILFEVLSPNGGCTKPCDIKMPSCGHKCPRACHSDLPGHADIYCPQPCARLHPECDHPCAKQCGEPCGPCLVPIGDIILDCGHEFKECTCFVDTHRSEIKCKNGVKKPIRKCGHEQIVPCWMDPETFLCKTPCSHPLACGHNCPGKCHSCNTEGGIKHQSCSRVCGASLACGHQCKSLCHSGAPCPPCESRCEIMACVHSQCRHACGISCSACLEPCDWECDHQGRCPLVCGAPCLRAPCDLRCSKLLECGHRCPSVCGEPCPPKSMCQACASDDIKATVVDFILFTQYSDLDLDLDPVIFLDCGHFFSMETLDGTFEMSKTYCGNGTTWEQDVFPALPASLTPLPGCPKCRVPCSKVRRYYRISKQAVLDKAETLFAIRVKESMTKASRLFNEISKLVDDLHLTIDRAVESLVRKGNSSFGKLICFIRYPPALKAYHASIRALEGKEHLIASLGVPKAQPRYLGDAFLMRSQFHRAVAETWKAQLPVLLRRLNCWENGFSAAQEALKAHERGSNQFNVSCAQLEVLEWRILRHQQTTEMAGQGQRRNKSTPVLKEEASELATYLEELQQNARPSFLAKYDVRLQALLKRLENYQRTGSYSVHYEPVSVEEMRQVFQASSGELRGTGHWYRCPNHHIYSIAGCGLAMEEALCPECGSTVGGHHHVLNPQNEHAQDLEREMT